MNLHGDTNAADKDGFSAQESRRLRSKGTGASGPRRAGFALAAFLALTALVSVTSPSAFAAGDANESSCPAVTEASPGFRTYLPDCRAYEMVTPPYTNDSILSNSTRGLEVAPSGNEIISGFAGAFAGAQNNLFQINRNADQDEYMMTRTPSGWNTESLAPSAEVFPSSFLMGLSETETFNPTLWALGPATRDESIYVRTADGTFDPVGPEVGPEQSAVRIPEYSNELNLVGASAELSHLVFSIEAYGPSTLAEQSGHSNLWPGDTTGPKDSSLYEYAYAGRPIAEPSLVGISNFGHLTSDAEAHLISNCGTELGSVVGVGAVAAGSRYNAVSKSGETVFFTAVACPGGPTVNELFARRGGTTTVPISEPSSQDCAECNTSVGLANAEFQGASEDGTKVFFTTRQELLPNEEGNNLYEFNFSAPQGRRVSAVSEAPSSGPSGLLGVARISEQGTRVYFVAEGALAGENAEGKSPIVGADNLYLYDTVSEATTFVGTLLDQSEAALIAQDEEAEQNSIFSQLTEKRGSEEAEIRGRYERGEISEVEMEEELYEAEQHFNFEIFQLLENFPGTRGPSGTLAEDRSVWKPRDERPVQTADDGQFLVFPSSADLTGEAEGGRTPQLYEYDASTGRLTIVSGALQTQLGASPTFQESPKIPSPRYLDEVRALGSDRAVTGDGSEVFFTSGGSRAPGTAAGSVDVFEYKGGSVHLISDGRDGSKAGVSGYSVTLGGIDPSGSNVSFTSKDPLVPAAAEEQQMIFDARRSGGFTEPMAGSPCAGESCQDASIPAPALAGPASAFFSGPGNSPPRHRKARKKNIKPRKLPKGSRHRPRKLPKGSRHRGRRSNDPNRGSGK